MKGQGALMQLKFFGSEDINLISNNDGVSKFKLKYKKYTNFAIESRDLNFSNKPLFGSIKLLLKYYKMVI